LYNKIQAAGQKLVQEKYSWDSVAQKMKLAFDKMTD
jgi:hypothetical protein